MEQAGHPTARSGTATGRDPFSTRHIVTFRLADDLFALPVEPVGQILPMLAVTPLPEGTAPPVDSLLGAIDFYGQVVPVIDLRLHVGLPCITLERDTPLIMARSGDLMVSLIVDEVTDVLAVRAADVTAPCDVLPVELGQSPVLAGLVRLPGATAGRLALLLDADHLFAPEQRAALVRAVELIRAQAGVA